MAQLKRMEQIGDDLWTDDFIPESTPMREFYRGKVICKCKTVKSIEKSCVKFIILNFIPVLTGGTGFLGQIYVEKLLRYVDI